MICKRPDSRSSNSPGLKMIRIAGFGNGFVADGECLVDQSTFFGEGVQQAVEQRAPR